MLTNKPIQIQTPSRDETKKSSFQIVKQALAVQLKPAYSSFNPKSLERKGKVDSPLDFLDLKFCSLTGCRTVINDYHYWILALADVCHSQERIQ